MDKYCVVERDFKENHAGSKAREDVAEIAALQGWKPLIVHHSERKGTLDKIRMSFLTIADWYRISRKVSDSSELLIQYPLAMYPKVSTLSIPFLRRMKKRQVKLVFLIHDLDSLRGINQEVEKNFLQEADVMIAHNQKMIHYLKEEKYPCTDIRSLNIFDYLTKQPVERRQREKKTVAIAGNLNLEKAGFVYRLGELETGIRFHLYGPNYKGENRSENICYEGQFPADQLPKMLQGGFGLVWDGSSLDSCEGVYGTYLKYNNPHKTSLYLASGIPVIIWKGAAMAEFIVKENVGIAVDSLRELPDVIGKMTDGEYCEMQMCAERLGEKLRAGQMLIRQLD